MFTSGPNFFSTALSFTFVDCNTQFPTRLLPPINKFKTNKLPSHSTLLGVNIGELGVHTMDWHWKWRVHPTWDIAPTYDIFISLMKILEAEYPKE